ncbi:MAG: LTA synthase family protein [Bacilli bacterium]|nr:LTA synthase family protein [Bacilli bacterium]
MKGKISELLKKLKHVNYKTVLRYIYINTINFLKYNRQFIYFVIFTVLSCTLLRYYTIGNLRTMEGTYFDIAVILLLGSIAYLFKPKKQFVYFLTIMLIFTLMNIVNTVYYAFFTSFASFSLLSTVSQTATVGGAVFEKLKIYHFIYLLMPICFTIIHIYLKKHDYIKAVELVEDGKKLFFGVAILGGICLFLNISTLEGKDISRFSKQWNREYVVERFGIIVYQGNDLFQTVRSKLNSIFGYEEAANEFVDYYVENTIPKSDNKYTNKFKGYNVVVIHLESIMSFLVDLKINGEEVTPNLNKLVHEGMYFDNFYPQVSTGTSSDSEFTFNTSLMPAQTGTVNVNFFDRDYVTLEKLLREKNYYTFSMHGNKASMWNRNKMHESLGYLDFYSKDYYDIDEVIGLGLSDHSFFLQSEKIISDINKNVKSKDNDYKNYMGTIITLSNHTPFDIDNYVDPTTLFDVTYHTGLKDENGEEIIYDYLEGKDFTTFGNYIQSVHYADECLGEFFDYVRSSSDYDKTLFVMYGDHAAQLSKKQFGLFVNYDFTTGEQKAKEDPTYIDYDYYENEIYKNTPFILWTKDKKIKGRVSYPMGMIDALPTISNMLGIYNPYALGHDIFEIKDDNVVVFPNGNFLTNKLYYNNSKNESRIFGMETIDDDYIEENRKYAEKILQISDDIIVYDLIKKDGYRIEEKKLEQ